MGKKKQIVTLILVAMVAVAGYLNWNYKNGNTALEVSVPIEEQADKVLGETKMVNGEVADVIADVILGIKADKETQRSKAMELLKSIGQDSTAAKESKDKANQELTTMALAIEQEVVIEGILKTKGFDEVIVFINNGNVHVSVVNEKPLDSALIAQIQDAVKNSITISSDKIKINEIK